MFILQHSKITFYTLVSRHIMKRYRGLENESLGLGTNSSGLGFGICGLTASALQRIPLGAMTSETFNRAAKLMLTDQGRGNDFLLLVQAAPLPFFSLSSLPLPSRFPPLSIPCFRSRLLLLPFPTFHSFPSHVNCQCQKP